MTEKYHISYEDMAPDQGMFSIYDIYYTQPYDVLMDSHKRTSRELETTWLALDGMILARRIRRGEQVIAADGFDAALDSLDDVDDEELEVMIAQAGERIFELRMHANIAIGALMSNRARGEFPWLL